MDEVLEAYFNVCYSFIFHSDVDRWILGNWNKPGINILLYDINLLRFFKTAIVLQCQFCSHF